MNTRKPVVAIMYGIRIIDEWVSVDVRRGKDVIWLNEVIRRED